MSIGEGIGDRYTVIAGGRVSALGVLLNGAGFVVQSAPSPGVTVLFLDEALGILNAIVTVSLESASPPLVGAPMYEIAHGPDGRTKTITTRLFTTGTPPTAPIGYTITFASIV